MWISLDRLAECDPQAHFIVHVPGWFEIQSQILAWLTPAESHRYLRTCVLLIIDTSDLLLSATAVRIQYLGEGFSVVTPPLAPALEIAVGQGGGDWDLAFSDADFPESSAQSVASHAMEGEHIDGVQGN